MAERKTVGIIYERNENWIGGTYYIQNLVSALCTLADEEKPNLVIFSKTKEEYEEIIQTGYPYLSYHILKYQPLNLTIAQRIANKLSLLLKGYIKFPQPVSLHTNSIDFLFPSPIEFQSSSVRKIYWIPDFQELYYPEFFSSETKTYRKQMHKYVANSTDHLVFSSENARNDFKKRFPSHKCHTHVLYFAVSHPSLNDSDIQSVRNKYGITTDFYISPNQLWKHKNQKLVIEAALLLQREGKLDFQVIFTGKESDDRNPEYPSRLKEMVIQNNLQHNIKFLGFIDRIDQLQLIKDSIAVIQPSLFEGWSTVIEDGKALNKFILASDIPIHREQLKNNCAYFDPVNAEQLAKCLLQNRNSLPVITDYKTAVANYAKQFISLINYAGKYN